MSTLKKGNLFKLIRSLTKTEKRYFRLTAGGGASNYVRLFDAYDEMEHFDESVIRTRFKGEVFVRQLHVTKIYLYELIMKSLRNFHAKSSINRQVLDLLIDIEILFSRELYEQAQLKVQKACRLAASYEKDALFSELLNWKRRISIVQGRLSRQEEKETLIAEAGIIERISDLHFYRKKTGMIFREYRDETFEKELVKRKPASLHASILHRHLLYSVSMLHGNAKQAEKEITALVTQLEKQPHRISEDPGPYVTAISNKIGLLLPRQRWEEISALILRMREVPLHFRLSGHSKFTLRLWLRIFNLELELYRDSRQLAKGLSLTKEAGKFIETHGTAVPEDYRIMIWFQCASICFLNKKYSQALKWINLIINSNFGDVRNELQCYCRILNLMVHYELDNIIVLRYAVDSCRRFMKKKKMLGTFEKEVLVLFSRLSVSGHVNAQEIFSARKDKLEKKFCDELGKMRDYIDLQDWMQEHVPKRR